MGLRKRSAREGLKETSSFRKPLAMSHRTGWPRVWLAIRLRRPYNAAVRLWSAAIHRRFWVPMWTRCVLPKRLTNNWPRVQSARAKSGDKSPHSKVRKRRTNSNAACGLLLPYCCTRRSQATVRPPTLFVCCEDGALPTNIQHPDERESTTHRRKHDASHFPQVAVCCVEEAVCKLVPSPFGRGLG